MIPVQPFVAPLPGSREHNAVKKAVKERPIVELKATGPMRDYYAVNQYTVEHYTDLDGQSFVECSCLAGTPPIDEVTKLPSREPSACYHVAALLAHIAEKENHVS